MVSMTPTRSELALDQVGAEVRRLVDSYPSRRLWFLREDCYPRSREEILRVLEQVERSGDRAAFVRAGAIRRWLSPPSRATSAGS